MSPTQPNPPRKKVAPTELDAVINRIDQTLPTIHRICRIQKKQKRNTTDTLPPERVKAMQERLRALSEDPILTENGSDIRDDKLPHINGAELSASNHQVDDAGGCAVPVEGD